MQNAHQAGELTDYMNDLFGIREKDYTQYSPLTLAYIGDDVYDLIIRTIAVKRANRQVEKLHRQVTGLVRAKTQSLLGQILLPHLTEEEKAVYQRGRNAKPYHTAKNASREDYLEATALEALIGYLYLQRRYERLLELVHMGLEEIGELTCITVK